MNLDSIDETLMYETATLVHGSILRAKFCRVLHRRTLPYIERSQEEISQMYTFELAERLLTQFRK
jgi:hypothetical protein